MRVITTLIALLATLGIAGPLCADETEESKPAVTFYGYLKLDTSWDDSLVNTGEFIRWVERGDADDDLFSMTIRQTRLGARFSGGGTANMKAGGLFEIDFYEGGAENKARPMIRHAYLTLDWADERFSLLAGQTWDIISPLNPDTVNYAVAWWVGNIGYRRPQLRLTKLFGDKDLLVTVTGGVSRTIGRDNLQNAVDTGEDSGTPTVQGRLAVSFAAPGGGATIGVSGHWGQEEFDVAGESLDVDTWSVNADLRATFGSSVIFQAEVFSGSNLDAFNGGIAQGINLAQHEAIDAVGGWAAVTFNASSDLVFNIGYALDDPDEEFLTAAMRDRNQALWLNSWLAVSKYVRLGAEVSRWETEYVDGESADSLRLQGSIVYSF